MKQSETTKNCKKCGAEIIYGENGYMLAGDVCSGCKPIEYYCEPKIGVPMSDNDLYAFEGMCIDDCE